MSNDEHRDEQLSEIHKKLARHKLLKSSEEAILTRMLQSDDPAERKIAREELVLKNIRLATKMANRHVNKGLTKEELIQEGVIGILKSQKKFDPSKGFKFSTYATWWIRQAQGRAIENTATSIRIPNHIQAKINKLNGKYKEYKDNNPDKGDPSAEILAELTGFSVAEVKRLGLLRNPTSSLDDHAGEEENSSILDYISSDNIFSDETTIYDRNPELAAERNTDRENLIKLIKSSLEKDDQRFMLLKYGLTDLGDTPRTDKEVADIFQITVSDVKKRHEELLKQLRSDINPDEFNYYQDYEED